MNQSTAVSIMAVRVRDTAPLKPVPENTFEIHTYLYILFVWSGATGGSVWVKCISKQSFTFKYKTMEKLTIVNDVKQKICGDFVCLSNFHQHSKLKKMTSVAKKRALKPTIIWTPHGMNDYKRKKREERERERQKLLFQLARDIWMWPNLITLRLEQIMLCCCWPERTKGV